MWPGCQASRLSEHSKSHSCCIWFDFPADTECSWMASQHPFFPCCISGSGTEQQRQTSSVWISSQEGQLPAPPPRPREVPPAFRVLSLQNNNQSPRGLHPLPPRPTGCIFLHSPHRYRPLCSRLSSSEGSPSLLGPLSFVSD